MSANRKVSFTFDLDEVEREGAISPDNDELTEYIVLRDGREVDGDFDDGRDEWSTHLLT